MARISDAVAFMRAKLGAALAERELAALVFESEAEAMRHLRLLHGE